VWVASVTRIFREENVHYDVDPLGGGVRFYIDEDFASSRASAVAAMSAPRYANAREEFEKGMAALARSPPDGKTAIRNVFAAAEGVFRLLVPSAPRLAASELSALTPLMQHLYASDKTALRALSKMLTSFRE
jgi:hypothetical protein